MFKDFDKFISDNRNNVMRVTKLRDRPKPQMGTSGIRSGEQFHGQARLITAEDAGAEGSWCILALDGGWTMRTSPIKDVSQKSASKWLIKTANSIYKVEVVSGK